MVAVRNLLISHGIVFLGGFALGKYIDKEELDMYRDLHESSFARFRRRAGQAAIAVLCFGGIIVVARSAGRSPIKE